MTKMIFVGIIGLFGVISIFLSCTNDDQDLPFLNDGEELSGSIDISEQDFFDFFIEVPKTTLSIGLAIYDTPIDLDMYLYHGEDLPLHNEYDFYAESKNSIEYLQIFRGRQIWFPSGINRVRVFFPSKDIPRANDLWISGYQQFEIPFTVKYEAIDYTEITQELTPGIPTEVFSDYSNHFISHFSLELSVENGFRIDVLEASTNIDLYLSEHPYPVVSHNDFVIISANLYGLESIVFPPASTEDYEVSKFYLTVKNDINLDPSSDQVQKQMLKSSFKIVAKEGVSLPDALPPIPEMPESENRSDKARLATAQLYMADAHGHGTGTLVSPEGFLLTNYHIAVKYSNVNNELLVGIPLKKSGDMTLYIAEIVEKNYEYDLALYRITKDRWGRKLPEDYRFHYWTPDLSHSYAPGDTIMLIGYPDIGLGLIGGNYTFSKGVYSGTDGPFDKTDAMASAGSSGGPVFNEDWHLIGIMNAVNSWKASTLTLFIPLRLVPNEWWRMISNE